MIGTSAPRASGSAVAGDDARHEQLIRLAAGFRLFARFGFDLGVAGHISLRDPVHPGRFWVNPLGRHFSKIRASDLVLVDHEGHVLNGNHEINHSAFVIHSRIHAARADVHAVAHAHSPYGTALSALGCPVVPITQNACVFYEDHAVLSDYTGPVVDLGEGQRIVESLGTAKAILLSNHGPLTVGTTVDEAVWWFICLERVAMMQLTAQAAGRPVEVGRQAALAARDTSGTPAAGRLAFRPLFEWIMATEPDLVG